MTEPENDWVVLCTGGRKWTDYLLVEKVLGDELYRHPKMAVVVGDARGLDEMVRTWAETHNVPCTVYIADWTYGRRGGMVRNQRMVDHRPKPDVCHAFPDRESKGTWHCIRISKKADIPTLVHEAA